MNYKLKKIYTERLDVSSFHQLVNGDEIKLGVNFNTSFMSSVKSTIPDVSIHVCIFSFFSFLNSSIRNFTCNKGSPPVTVTPPF